MRAAKQFLTYVNGAPFQPASPPASACPTTFIAGVAEDLARAAATCSRPASAGSGFEVCPPAGTYFVTTDIRALRRARRGWPSAAQLPERCGVVAIPSSVFYDDKQAGRSLVRWAFCKRPEVLDEALRRLEPLGR